MGGMIDSYQSGDTGEVGSERGEMRVTGPGVVSNRSHRTKYWINTVHVT